MASLQRPSTPRIRWWIVWVTLGLVGVLSAAGLWISYVSVGGFVRGIENGTILTGQTFQGAILNDLGQSVTVERCGATCTKTGRSVHLAAGETTRVAFKVRAHNLWKVLDAKGSVVGCLDIYPTTVMRGFVEHTIGRGTCPAG